MDAGCVMLMDPCYTFPNTPWDNVGPTAPPNFGERWYDEVICNGSHEPVRMIRAAGTDGPTGVLVDSGFGDGTYPVYVRYSDEGSWGRRVAEVRIVFIGDDDEDESDED